MERDVDPELELNDKIEEVNSSIARTEQFIRLYMELQEKYARTGEAEIADSFDGVIEVATRVKKAHEYERSVYKQELGNIASYRNL